jgi:hypothetical protein
MLIKVLLLVAILVVAALALRAPSGARHLAVRRMSVVAFAGLAALSVVFPDAWNTAAAWVGVGRGTDLLLYGLIVFTFASQATTYRRFRELEQRFTELARRLAVDEAVGPRLTDPAPAAADDSGRDTPAS